MPLARPKKGGSPDRFTKLAVLAEFEGLIVTPVKIMPETERFYQGKERADSPGTNALVNIAAFRMGSDEPTFFEGVELDKNALTESLPEVGVPMLARVIKKQGDNGNYWSWDDPPRDAEVKIEEWHLSNNSESQEPPGFD